MQRQELADKINEKYGSQAAFGLAVGWIPQKVYRMLNNQYDPKFGEAIQIGKALGISLNELASFFTQ
ncbi:MAG: helix-turn-helix transcriptional regulator [Oscillospiraceae bacterium]|nr:helix-turn-helix transcriptional regulator [Oscillospiraceae bacterium]